MHDPLEKVVVPFFKLLKWVSLTFLFSLTGWIISAAILKFFPNVLQHFLYLANITDIFAIALKVSSGILGGLILIAVTTISIIIFTGRHFSAPAKRLRSALKLVKSGQTKMAISLVSKTNRQEQADNDIFMKNVPDEGFAAKELRNLGRSLYEQKRYEDALNAYQEAGKLLSTVKVKSPPVDLDVELLKNYGDCGNCLIVLGRFDEGFMAFEECHRLFSELPQALWRGTNVTLRAMLTRQASIYREHGRATELAQTESYIKQLDSSLKLHLSGTKLVDYWYQWPQVDCCGNK